MSYEERRPRLLLRELESSPLVRGNLRELACEHAIRKWREWIGEEEDGESEISQSIDSWQRFRELVISPEAISESDRASGVGACVVDFAANAVTIVYCEPTTKPYKGLLPACG
ncbi:hypothetical protein HZH68_006483 [Vespula germanica]|uniref:Uncharacterized protein n=1 Tax=Vespula germanica TaxID=30212 RepID=A0A834KAX7_VESGE|nr:hypothetical protein HZH68_006483 [Vespula germanica]